MAGVAPQESVSAPILTRRGDCASIARAIPPAIVSTMPSTSRTRRPAVTGRPDLGRLGQQRLYERAGRRTLPLARSDAKGDDRRAAVLPSPPGGSASRSALADHVSDIPQEGVAVHDRRPAVLDHPLLAEVSVFALGWCALLLPSRLARCLEHVLAGEHGVVRDQPLPPDDPLLIHQEERPPCSRIWPMLDHHVAVLNGANLVWPKDAVIPDNLEVRGVAEERVRELKRLRERLLCEGMVSADPENLDV